MKKILKYIALELIILLGFVMQGWAQCSTCKGVAQSKDADGEYFVGGINMAILYLLALPLFMPIVYGVVWYIRTKKKKVEQV